MRRTRCFRKLQASTKMGPKMDWWRLLTSPSSPRRKTRCEKSLRRMKGETFSSKGVFFGFYSGQLPPKLAKLNFLFCLSWISIFISFFHNTLTFWNRNRFGFSISSISARFPVCVIEDWAQWKRNATSSWFSDLASGPLPPANTPDKISATSAGPSWPKKVTSELISCQKWSWTEGKWVRNRRTVSQELKVTLLHSKIVIFVKKTLNWKDKSTIMARYLIEICVWLLIEWKSYVSIYDPCYNCSWLSKAGGVGWYAQLKRALTLLETAIWTLQVWWNGFAGPLEEMRCSTVIEMEAWWWSEPSKA